MTATPERFVPVLIVAALWAGTGRAHAGDARHASWRHLSTKTGDLLPPNSGNEQTSLAVADLDGDGVSDFVVTERTKAPSVVLYRRTKSGWNRSVVDASARRIEAGTEAFDEGGTTYTPSVIDASYQFTRSSSSRADGPRSC